MNAFMNFISNLPSDQSSKDALEDTLVYFVGDMMHHQAFYFGLLREMITDSNSFSAYVYLQFMNKVNASEKVISNFKLIITDELNTNKSTTPNETIPNHSNPSITSYNCMNSELRIGDKF